MSTIGLSALEQVKMNSETPYCGETKKAKIKLVAYTRFEYIEEINVPIEFNEDDLSALACEAEDNAEGSGEYVSDKEYWQRDAPEAYLVN